MSVVTSVILTMTAGEDGFDEEFNGGTTKLDALNETLADHGKMPLACLTDHMCRGKHPQTLTFGGGYNYFPTEAFTVAVQGIEWAYPENVVLIIQPEEGPTSVWRPIDYDPGA